MDEKLVGLRERKFTLKSLQEQLAKLDAYPKTLEDFRIKTVGGASVTILSIFFISLLFVLELHYFMTPFVQEELIVDISSGKKLKINIDIVFPHVVCSHLSLDATDISGEQHINIQHSIFKRRLNENGDPIELPQKDNSITTKKSKDLKSKQDFEKILNATLTLDPNRCESCYGADSSIRKCCNTCNEVRQAYNAMGWVFNPADMEQCRREGVKSETLPKEGCQIFGNIEVNKIAGNFHIALGHSFEKHHVHVHDISLGDLLTMNTSHKINHLSFGEKLDKTVNQLDGTSFISKEGHGLATFQYYTKIIPTIYKSFNGTEIQTNQFSVTRYKKEFGSSMDAIGDARLPGVFFIYEFSPMMVKYSETSRSFLNFITTLCAIIGGVFSVAGYLDSLLYHSYRAIKTKIQLGKMT